MPYVHYSSSMAKRSHVNQHMHCLTLHKRLLGMFGDTCHWAGGTTQPLLPYLTYTGTRRGSLGLIDSVMIFDNCHFGGEIRNLVLISTLKVASGSQTLDVRLSFGRWAIPITIVCRIWRGQYEANRLANVFLHLLLSN